MSIYVKYTDETGYPWPSESSLAVSVERVLVGEDHRGGPRPDKASERNSQLLGLLTEKLVDAGILTVDDINGFFSDMGIYYAKVEKTDSD